jgi:hypothetical protein
MSSWHSYPSIYALGHRAVEELLLDDVICEEKIDGSQISFGKFNNELKIRSKGKEMIPDDPEKMFTKGVETIKTLDLHDGWTYRGEFLSKPKYNALAYDRIPKGYIILFDINVDEEKYLSYDEKKKECDRIGLECVPLLKTGKINSANDVLSFLELTSIFGGQKIEGVVIKNYSRFGRDKKVLMGKYVSEAYKEVHRSEWKISNPTQGDVVQKLICEYKTHARWNKAIQHLREKGKLQNSPKDIGNLLKEVKEDIKKECEDEIKDALYRWGIDQILRGCCGGLPEWYKEQLLNNQFEKKNDNV